MTSRLKEKYNQEVIPALMERFHYKNVMEVPKLNKIVINMGLGSSKDNPKAVKSAVSELELISGQKPVVTLAKKSIANFKLREGVKIGTKVTLRGEKMYDFLDKLVSVALPRVRDFRGINPNYSDRKSVV